MKPMGKFKYKCTCLWSKDDEYGFISSINCPVHGKQAKKMIKKAVPLNKTNLGFMNDKYGEHNLDVNFNKKGHKL